MPTTPRPALPVVVSVTVLALALLGAYCLLVLNGRDADGLVQAVVTLLGVVGLGAHVEHRTRQQNHIIAKIDRQTNGVLSERIEAGSERAVRRVLRQAGYRIDGPED